MMKAEIGIIGGSGFYKLLDDADLIKVETPYSSPSAKIALGVLSGKKVAFLPRHGFDHELPPGRIPYKANLWALKSLGVRRVIAVTACGSLQSKIRRGDFVIIDQFIDRTKYREDTYFNGPLTTHISTADPYCSEMAKVCYARAEKLGIRIHKSGTLVIIEGPRFSTRAESEWFTKMGWDIINMTGYPEVTLAKEQELCYSAIALVTDYDVGVVAKEKIKPVSMDEISKTFKENNENAQKLVIQIIKDLPENFDCACQNSLKGAQI